MLHSLQNSWNTVRGLPELGRPVLSAAGLGGSRAAAGIAAEATSERGRWSVFILPSGNGETASDREAKETERRRQGFQWGNICLTC